MKSLQEKSNVILSIDYPNKILDCFILKSYYDNDYLEKFDGLTIKFFTHLKNKNFKYLLNKKYDYLYNILQTICKSNLIDIEILNSKDINYIDYLIKFNISSYIFTSYDIYLNTNMICYLVHNNNIIMTEYILQKFDCDKFKYNYSTIPPTSPISIALYYKNIEMYTMLLKYYELDGYSRQSQYTDIMMLSSIDNIIFLKLSLSHLKNHNNSSYVNYENIFSIENLNFLKNKLNSVVYTKILLSMKKYTPPYIVPSLQSYCKKNLLFSDVNKLNNSIKFKLLAFI